MKILSLIETMNHGGAESVATQLALGLSGHDLRFFHYSGANGCTGHPPFFERLKAAGTPVFDVHWSMLEGPQGRQELLGDWRPDLVLFHWWKGHPIRAWIEEMSKGDNDSRPVFVCVLHHQGDPDGPLYDHYVAVTPSQLTNLSAQKRKRTSLIPNGVDADPFADIKPRALDERFVIGRVSSLRAGKIPRDWVLTAKRFAIPDAHWVIAGEGQLRAGLERQASGLEFNEEFSFPGYVNEERRSEILSGFDLYCYITGAMPEAHPLALIEAAAAGLPIVAEARGGIPDIVEHGVNGLLGSSISEIGTHLHRLRRDADLRRSFGAASREIAERFSVARQLSGYEALFAKLFA